MVQVKIFQVSSMDVQNARVEPLEDQVNAFCKLVIPVQFSYSIIPGYQSVLIAYEEKAKKRIQPLDEEALVP